MDNNFVKPLFMERMMPMQRGIPQEMNLPGHGQFLEQPALAAKMHAMAPAVNRQEPEEQSPESISSERPSGNPLTRGSMEAMRAHMASMREMTQPTEEDRQRAMGMALVRWAAENSKPAQEGESYMSHATQAMGPAMESYQGHLAGQAQQNAMLYGAVREDQRYERERAQALAKASEDKRRYDETLAERKAYHEGMVNKKTGKESDVTSHPIPEGAIRLSKLPKSAQAKYQTQIINESQRGQTASEAKNVLTEMDKIFESNPNIATAWAQVTVPKNNDEKLNPFDVIGMRLTNPKDIDDLQVLNKLNADLVTLTSQLGASGGSRVTNLERSLRMQGKPGSKLSFNAYKKARDNTARSLDKYVTRGEEVDEHVANDYYLPPSTAEKLRKKDKGETASSVRREPEQSSVSSAAASNKPMYNSVAEIRQALPEYSKGKSDAQLIKEAIESGLYNIER